MSTTRPVCPKCFTKLNVVVCASRWRCTYCRLVFKEAE